jgi:hypothetical protein
LLYNSFRYEAITPITLSSGQTYFIGAGITSPYSDEYRGSATVSLDPAITLTGSARNATSGGFSFPSTVTTGTGRIGPNFEFAAATPVPFDFSPNFGIGILGGAWFVHRTLKKKAAIASKK